MQPHHRSKIQRWVLSRVSNRIDFSKTDVLEVRLKNHNTGAVSGSEVVQLYVHPEQSRLKRPHI
ncbi:MAG: hypothetical protein QGH49_02515 [SAR324 cluster bacterium]|jgi:hypothetical protein|nr:hypothetical protein [SAR324 cluster bacterium]